MARQWLPLSILLVLAIGVFLFLNQGNEPRKVDPVTPPVVVEESPEAAEETPEVASASDLVAADVPLERVTLDLPSQASSVKYGTPAEEGILVTVVDGDSSEPMPTADVIVLDTGVVDERELQAQLTSSPDFEALFQYLGVTYHTDDKAQVIIPEPVGDLIIAGRTDTHFNFAFDVDTDSGELTLRLNPIRLLGVKVVDGTGRPVEGAPVSLRMRSGYYTQDLMRSDTDREGIADLKLFDLLFTMLGDEDTFAALLVLTPTPVEAPIDFQDLPKVPPVLVLPEVGRVEVHVLDADGKLQTEDFMVDLAIVDPNDAPSDGSGPENWENPQEHLTNRTSNGKAYFPLVAYEQHLEARVVSMDGERREVVQGPGPVRGGQPVVFTVAPEVKSPILTGRILNAEGMVGKNLNLGKQIKIKSPGSSSTHNSSVKTDGEGRFRLLLDDDFEPGGTRTLTLTMKATKRKAQRTVKVDISQDYPPGEHDLGDLVVMIPPLVATGTILGADGTPLKNAQVRPEHKEFWGDDLDDFYWTGGWDLRTETASDGTFKIHGNLEPGDYRLLVNHDKHSSATREIHLGATDVVIQMEAAVEVVGRILMDDHIDPKGVTVHLMRLENDGKGNMQHQSEVAKDGSFDFTGQEMGGVKLSVRSEFLGEELFSLPDLALVAKGGTQKIPDIDLRGQLLGLHLEVVNESGKKVQQIEITPEDGQMRRGWHQNPVTIVSAEQSLNIEVGADGYRSQKLQGLREDQKVVLREGLRCTIQVANMGALPNGWSLHASVNRQQEDPSDSTMHIMGHGTYRELNLDEFGKGEVILTSPGRYQVDFTISNDNSESRSNTRWGLNSRNTEAVIEVLDSSAPQRFSVVFPEDNLESTMENALGND